MEFKRSPNDVITSLGKPVKMQCSVVTKGLKRLAPTEVLWMKDGEILQYAETSQFHLPYNMNNWIVISVLR